mmetsp:Transcript_59370/g.126242  ORF Transcript_59370/g.126242 Transcript_59370/m.126242 type:complete len:210 (-) Transcript_59370:25-654(-)
MMSGSYPSDSSSLPACSISSTPSPTKSGSAHPVNRPVLVHSLSPHLSKISDPGCFVPFAPPTTFPTLLAALFANLNGFNAALCHLGSESMGLYCADSRLIDRFSSCGERHAEYCSMVISSLLSPDPTREEARSRDDDDDADADDAAGFGASGSGSGSASFLVGGEKDATREGSDDSSRRVAAAGRRDFMATSRWAVRERERFSVMMAFR